MAGTFRDNKNKYYKKILTEEEILQILNQSDKEESGDEFEDILLEESENSDGTDDDQEDTSTENSKSPQPVQTTPANTRDLKWKKKVMQCQGPPLQEILLPESEHEKGILQSFLEYLPLEFWKDHAEQTNLYSVQQRNHKSVNTSTEEVIHLAGIHVMMGVLGYPQSKMYWQRDTEVAIISNCMSRDRFFELRNFMHFCDNESVHEEGDRLWKVKPFLNYIRQQCLTLPRPQHVSLDEQMVPFSGRCIFRQYVPSKPNPLGLKSFVLAAPDGLVLDFLFYVGAGTVPAEDMKEYGLGASVVKALTKSIPQDGTHCVYTDRFFTSIKCVDLLLSRNILLTGTVMKNRVGPVIDKLKKDNELKRGEWDEWVREDEKVCLLKWKDNKSVLLLSSCIGSEPVGQCKRWSKEKKMKVDVPQPQVIKSYNEKMGGVDLCDRYMSYYRCYIRTRKWTVRLFNHFVDFVVVNCWIMYHRWCSSTSVPKKDRMSLMDYKMYLAKALIGYRSASETARKRGRPSLHQENEDEPNGKEENKKRKVIQAPISEIRFDQVGHIPRFIDAKNASKCRNPGCHSKTRVMCTKCEMYLCIMKNNCFEKYHCK